MNYLKLFLLILYLFLEISVLPHYQDSYLNGKICFLYSTLIKALLIKLAFRKYNKLIPFSIAIFEAYAGFALYGAYWDKSFLITDISFFLVTYFITLTCFILTDNSQALKEYKHSFYAQNIIGLFTGISFTYYFYQHFTGNYLKQAESLKGNLDEVIHQVSHNKDFIKQVGMDFLANFILSFNLPLVIELVKQFLSNSKERFNTKNFILNNFKRMIGLALITIAFYMNYNPSLNNFIYSKFMELVPQPHNVILYNSMPLDRDIRFKIIVTMIISTVI